MSEPVAKERPIVDLDDFERRLRQQDHQYEDPLAELARLVGESSDPYGEVFAQEAVAFQAPTSQSYQRQPSRPTAGHDAAYHEGEDGISPRLSGDFAAIEAGLRGALSAHPEADAYGAGRDYYPQPTPYTHQLHDADQDHYAHHGEGYRQDDEGQRWAEAPRQDATQVPQRSRRPIYAMVATIAIGVIGVGLAFAYKGSSSSPSEIRTIAAAPGPTKIQPPADAASDQGNQDPALLGKSGQQVPTRLVNGEEQPVDISQAVQDNASRNADAGASPGDASSVPVPSVTGQGNNAADATPGALPSSAASTPSPDQMPAFGLSEMPATKKVKVVSVRPDGTILSNDQPPIADTPTQLPSMASDRSRPIARASTPKATPKSTSRVATMVKPTVSGSDDGGAPAPKPVRKIKPKPIHVASAEPMTDGGNAASDIAVPTSGGGFAVQLAAPGSEAEARAATSRLAKKYADALDGRHLGVRKAQSNGKSVFRVRVSSLTKEDAASLCEKLKANGGTCFVAKN